MLIWEKMAACFLASPYAGAHVKGSWLKISTALLPLSHFVRWDIRSLLLGPVVPAYGRLANENYVFLIKVTQDSSFEPLITHLRTLYDECQYELTSNSMFTFVSRLCSSEIYPLRRWCGSTVNIPSINTLSRCRPFLLMLLMVSPDVVVFKCDHILPLPLIFASVIQEQHQQSTTYRHHSRVEI